MGVLLQNFLRHCFARRLALLHRRAKQCLKNFATKRPIINVCKVKNELLFATQNYFLLKKCGINVKWAEEEVGR